MATKRGTGSFTPADDMASQIIADSGNFTADFKQLHFCASPVFLQTLDFHLKRGLGPTGTTTFSPYCRFVQTLLAFLVQEWLDAWNSSAVAVMQTSVCDGSVSVHSDFWVTLAWPSLKAAVILAWQSCQGCSHPCHLCTFSNHIFPLLLRHF